MKTSPLSGARDIVCRMEQLARLHFPDQDLERLIAKSDAVLAHVAALQEIDTTGIEPMSHPIDSSPWLREDKACRSDTAAPILTAAPDHDDHFFQVPKVLDAE